ncbi:MAG: hypothetical protein QXX79_06050 [Candidatus Bathyarchaeia archaeon]
MEFEGTPRNALLKECLWKMGKIQESREGGYYEASQYPEQRRAYKPSVMQTAIQTSTLNSF